MAHDPDPLPVPAENAVHDFVLFERLDFAAEETANAGERDVHRPTRAQGVFEEVTDQVRSRDVEVGEVRRVRLVQVKVALVHGGAGGSGHGGEEVVGCGNEGAATEEMVEKGAVEAELGLASAGESIGGGEELTCHVKGRDLTFTRASARKKILNIEAQLGGPFEAICRSLLRAAMAMVSGVESERLLNGWEEFMMLGFWLVMRLRRAKTVGLLIPRQPGEGEERRGEKRKKRRKKMRKKRRGEKERREEERRREEKKKDKNRAGREEGETKEEEPNRGERADQTATTTGRPRHRRVNT